MEWHEIIVWLVSLIVGTGVLAYIGKLIVRLTKVADTMELHTREVKIMGAKVDATVTANEKQNGNGYSGYYQDALNQNLKMLEIKLGN